MHIVLLTGLLLAAGSVSDGRGNRCLCEDELADCKVSSTSLMPPAPVPQLPNDTQ